MITTPRNHHCYLNNENIDEIFSQEQEKPAYKAKTLSLDRDSKVILSTLLLTLIYATIRYNVFKGVDWSDWVLYTFNKALAFSSLILLAISLYRYQFLPQQSINKLMYYAGVLSSLHTLISLILLNPQYYGSFFYNGKLAFEAGLAILLGLIAYLLMKEGKQIKWTDQSIALLILLSLVAIHTLLQGYKGWFSPQKWPAFLPPITLLSTSISLAIISLSLVFKMRVTRQKSLWINFFENTRLLSQKNSF